MTENNVHVRFRNFLHQWIIEFHSPAPAQSQQTDKILAVNSNDVDDDSKTVTAMAPARSKKTLTRCTKLLGKLENDKVKEVGKRCVCQKCKETLPWKIFEDAILLLPGKRSRELPR